MGGKSMKALGQARRTMILGAILVAIFSAASISHAGPAEKRAITDKDLLKFHWVADPEISPDGRQVAYVLVAVNEKEDRYETSLWSVETSGGSVPRLLTGGPRDSAPRWSPDGRMLAFLRSGEKDPP